MYQLCLVWAFLFGVGSTLCTKEWTWKKNLSKQEERWFGRFELAGIGVPTICSVEWLPTDGTLLVFVPLWGVMFAGIFSWGFLLALFARWISWKIHLKMRQ